MPLRSIPEDTKTRHQDLQCHRRVSRPRELRRPGGRAFYPAAGRGGRSSSWSLSGGLRRWPMSVAETRPRREPRRLQVQRVPLRPQERQRDERRERRQAKLNVRQLPAGDGRDERLQRQNQCRPSREETENDRHAAKQLEQPYDPRPENARHQAAGGHQLGGPGESGPVEVADQRLQAEHDERTTEHDPKRERGVMTPSFQHLLFTSFTRLQHVDFDFLRPDLFCLWEPHFEHPVAESRCHSARLDRHGQLDRALKLSVGALDVVGVVVLQFLAELALTSHREQIAGNRQRDVLLPYTRDFEVQDEIVVRFVHVDDRHPDSASCSSRRRRRTAEDTVEQSVHLALDITEGLSLRESPKGPIAMANPPCRLTWPASLLASVDG